MTFAFDLNGKAVSGDDGSVLLIDFLRYQLHLSGTKAACREGDCGSCQVLVKSPAARMFKAMPSCLMRLQDCQNCQVITIDGLPKNNPLITTLASSGASQCGYCSPGLTIGLINWLLNGKALSETEGASFINANLCRCTGYMGQKRAIKAIGEEYSHLLLSAEDRVAFLQKVNVLPKIVVHAYHQNTTPAQSPYYAQVQNKSAAILAGGGTDLYLHNKPSENPVISLLKTGEDHVVRMSDDCVSISALHPIQLVADTIDTLACLPAFSSFNHWFASLPIRNRATLGGNLANASPIADGICFFMALDTIIETNLRQVPIGQLFSGFKQTDLSLNEVITWLHVPKSVTRDYIYFEKVSRRGTTDIAVVNCCGRWQITDNNVSRVALVLGGASPVPVRLTSLENNLLGHSLQESIEELVDTHLDAAISPIDDSRGSKVYRRLLAKQLLLSQWESVKEKANHA
ncbi:MAG: FAD binding domain-containing protein [Hahellaceae bacterium]|nr:FAD binding domain-containing protein [Hahellaceae bacterium]MCP5210008.1 FAD binding domain-containing protein [Hahellaceae bacterium]